MDTWRGKIASDCTCHILCIYCQEVRLQYQHSQALASYCFAGLEDDCANCKIVQESALKIKLISNAGER